MLIQLEICYPKKRNANCQRNNYNQTRTLHVPEGPQTIRASVVQRVQATAALLVSLPDTT